MLNCDSGWRGSCVFAGTVTDAIVSSNRLFPGLPSRAFDRGSRSLPWPIPFARPTTILRFAFPESSSGRRRYLERFAVSVGSNHRVEPRKRRIKTPDCATALSAVQPLRLPAACGARSRRQFYQYHRHCQDADSLSNFPKVCPGNASDELLR